MNSILKNSILELRGLFEEELADVGFPNIDAGVLSDLQGEVDAFSSEVARCEEALDAANRAREVREEALIRTAILAQRYMRIYASDDDALLERVNEIQLEHKPTKKVRRSRKRKAEHTMPLSLQSDGEDETGTDAATAA